MTDDPSPETDGGLAVRGRVRVGTCGWQYRDWRGRFYPPGLATNRWLAHYATIFPAVEVDASFYRLPTEAAIAAWRRTAAEHPGFRFALKGSRLITHVRRLADCEAELRRFVDRIQPLAEAGAVAFLLWQLPPSLRRDPPRLADFLALLTAEASRFRHVVEFRHPSWLTDDVLADLATARVACCWVSSTIMPPVAPRTSDLVALRFHGLAGGWAHDYTDPELRPWADRLRAAARDGCEAYAFFNNDTLALAPKNARRLVELLGEAALPWPGPAAPPRPADGSATGASTPADGRPNANDQRP
ncbi:MAG TPA: DUF72 domain-containing protein [Candidatus Binatia bacterium]|nr:DUF72 domain-containing protein [Candidatus Binatia bacterium]